MMSATAPKITIITAVFNGAQTLERCLLSCFEQNYHNKEVIVIDGGSTDDTIKILNKYSQQITFWVSEPDTGIYNAWNKALKKSTGEWICFLGCDDWWCSASKLTELSEYANYPEVNFVSGKMYLVNSYGEVVESIGRPFNHRKLFAGIQIAHPSSLHHRSLFETYGFFDESYKISGDYEFLLRAGSAIQAAFVPTNLVYMSNGGVGYTNVTLTLDEGYRALKQTKNFGWVAALKFALLCKWSALKKFLTKTLIRP